MTAQPDISAALAAFAAGRLAEAEAGLREALRLAPDRADLHCHLADVLFAGGRLEEAEPHFREALARDPAYVAALNNLGNLLQQTGEHDEAATLYRAALAAAPESAAVRINFAKTLQEQGRLDEALAMYREAVAFAPDLSLAHTGLLLSLHYHPKTTAADLLREHRAWAARHAAPLRAALHPHRNSAQPERRLRIGYVSGDLWNHPVARFLLPLLEQHDHRQFEIFAYAATPRADEMTARLRARVDGWRDIARLDDAAAAELIRRDGIDILVDLSAHTAETRLLLFAHKPAPVQVTYLAYCSTTGLDTIDYRFSDPFLDPPGTDLANYSEATFRLPETYWCYSAPEPDVAPAQPPSLRAGFVTFGCLNNLAKVTAVTLHAWIDLLQSLPTSRLVLFAASAASGERVRRAFAAGQVDPARLEFVGRQDYASYLATYRRIDVALDPFPFAGGTTTCDALWMGVPVVTLHGQTAVGRAGASLLANVGLPELVAASTTDYVAIAARLACDQTRLRELHATLRDRMQRSRLMDAPRFTRDVENAFRQMWRTWCGQSQAAAAAFAEAVNHHRTGRLPDAEKLYRAILARTPDHAGARHLLGVIAHQAGRHDVAVELISSATTLDPHDAEMWNNLGQALERLGRPDDALRAYDEAVRLRPEFAEAHNNRGNLLVARRVFDDASAAYRAAIRLRPDYAKAHHNLGGALLAAGQAAAAAEAFRAAIRLQPNWPLPHKGLGDALGARGETEAAIAAYQAGLAVAPDDPVLLNNLGLQLRQAGRLEHAIAALQTALARQPDFAETELNLATMLREQGNLDACLGHYRHALALRPNHPVAHSAYLFNLHYEPGVSAASLLDEHRRWNERHARPLQAEWRAHANTTERGRRLRIGYVSADLRNHPVGRNVYPLFAEHDRDAFEIFAYAHVDEPDELTARLRLHVDQWRATRALTDEALAAQIRADRIDLLVDLNLHTDGNRLLVFARKPAPVAVTFAGYPGTTGLDAIDYRLTDPWLDPPGARDELYAERSFRLQHSFWCFAPIDDRALPRPARPADEPFTWGCLNNAIKITAPMLAVWAEILRATPGSRLRVLAHTAYHRARIAAALQRGGIASDRVEFVAKQPRAAYLEQYLRCDVMLDTFPYNGHTTTCDALWMGVPVVTLVGETAVARGGLSLLSNLGLAELAAQSTDDYVHLALSLARDAARRESLQATLRSRMEASPLMNAPGFARQVESAYREMWQRWCEGAWS